MRDTHRPLDPTFVKAQIAMLRARNPEVWEEEQLLADALEGETNLHEFLTLAVAAIVKAEAFAAGIKMLITDTRERQDRYERRAEQLRQLVFALLNNAGTNKVELLQATLMVRAGSPRVIITDEAALPDNVVRIKREPAKALIKDLIDQGVFVPGAELSNAEPVLAMRIK